MEIRKILVGTDFSDASEIALEQAVSLAVALGAEVALVHVGSVQERSRHAHTRGGSSEEIERLAREQLSADAARLDDLAARLSGRGLTVSHRVVEAYPDEGLCQAAREEGADLIVCGTHGRTGIQRLLLGSVAERVVRLSDRPVMVARSGRGGGEDGYRRILVPTDFSDLAERALELAVTLAGDGAKVELFHSWQLPPAASGYELDSVLEDIQREVEAFGNELVAKHAGEGVDLEFHAMRNTPTQGIQLRLEQDDFDLVVLGSHGRRGLSRFFLGSVAEMTVRHAPCSVAVVHGPKPG